MAFKWRFINLSQLFLIENWARALPSPRIVQALHPGGQAMVLDLPNWLRWCVLKSTPCGTDTAPGGAS